MHVSLVVLNDVTVLLGMRQSIVLSSFVWFFLSENLPVHYFSPSWIPPLVSAPGSQICLCHGGSQTHGFQKIMKTEKENNRVKHKINCVHMAWSYNLLGCSGLFLYKIRTIPWRNCMRIFPPLITDYLSTQWQNGPSYCDKKVFIKICMAQSFILAIYLWGRGKLCWWLGRSCNCDCYLSTKMIMELSCNWLMPFSQDQVACH